MDCDEDTDPVGLYTGVVSAPPAVDEEIGAGV